MEYSTLEEISRYVKDTVDRYWRLNISEEEFIDVVEEVFHHEKNRGIVMRGSKFSSTFERKMGKKRMEELKDALRKIDPERYRSL